MLYWTELYPETDIHADPHRLYDDAGFPENWQAVSSMAQGHLYGLLWQWKHLNRYGKSSEWILLALIHASWRRLFVSCGKQLPFVVHAVKGDMAAGLLPTAEGRTVIVLKCPYCGRTVRLEWLIQTSLFWISNHDQRNGSVQASLQW